MLPEHFETVQACFPTHARTPKGDVFIQISSFGYCQEELTALFSCMCYSHEELAALACDIMSGGRFTFVPPESFVL